MYISANSILTLGFNISLCHPIKCLISFTIYQIVRNDLTLQGGLPAPDQSELSREHR